MNNPAGLFNYKHLIFTSLSLIIIVLTLFFLRKKKLKELNLFFQIEAIVLFVLEVFKIIWNIGFREGVKVEDYLPLYFCSFFLFAILIYAFIKKDNLLKRISKLFLIYGGISGGLAFIFFPTSSLLVFNIYHPLTIHSLIYHSLMVITAFLILKEHQVSLRDFKLYSLSLGALEVVILLINYLGDFNFMFLNKPYGLEIFLKLSQIFKNFYPIVMAIGQIIVTFFSSFILSFIFQKKKAKKDPTI